MKLNLNNISMSYGKLKVLKDISLNIDNYNAVAVIGSSGCGKSTLLRLLAGIEFPLQGEISINNLQVIHSTVKEYQKHIGFVFQDHNLFAHLSLKRNITLILEKCRQISPKDAEEKADSLLKMLQLEEQANKLPRHVSGGQSQRASIARALSTDPDILLLDEPTASLDPILTHEVLKSIKNLKSIGKDFIFVTHELSFVKHFADYYIYIDDGKIIEHNTIDMLSSPQTDELLQFMENVSY